MPEIKAKVVLADIEGTTTSISFVKEVLFPYAKKHTDAYLNETWQDPETQKLVKKLTKLQQFKHFCQEAAYTNEQQITAKIVAKFVNYLIEKDLKLEPLKTLQGLVWAIGYRDGVLKGHVYPDVPVAFRRWCSAGLRIAIYSSGSVKAQQLLFGQSEMGNLLPYISAHFDTSIGHKQEAESYIKIVEKLAVESNEILFLTDVVKEAEAARDAGMQTIVVSRSANAPLTDDEKTEYTIVENFDEIQLSLI